MVCKSHFWAYIQKKKKNTNFKRYIHPDVHNTTIYNSQDTKATYVSIIRGLKMWCIYIFLYNGILLSHKKNERSPFSATWMDLEDIMLSEICLSGDFLAVQRLRLDAFIARAPV